jgi:hypothetical protein
MGEYFSDLHTKKNKNNIATSYTTYQFHEFFREIDFTEKSSGHQFWNISVLLYANSITNVVSYIIAAADAWCV